MECKDAEEIVQISTPMTTSRVSDNGQKNKHAILFHAQVNVESQLMAVKVVVVFYINDFYINDGRGSFDE